MRCQEGQLIAAGKEPHEDHGIRRVFEGAQKDCAKTFLQLCLRRHGLGAQEGQGKQAEQDRHREDAKHGLPVVMVQQELRRGGADHLPHRPRRRGNTQSHAAVFGARGAAHNGQDHAKARARDAKAHQNFQKLHGAGGAGIAAEQQAKGIHQSPRDDSAPVAKPFGQRAKHRLA